ncbi:MAG: hypothetical protein KKD39_08645, partial [Candidatus Altiarchaeota archaeon]|nr:hypothetical protein [Candidatus Altiarchaeota archaeon]
MKQKIADYVRKNIASGKTEENIRQELRSIGVEESEVSDALMQVKGGDMQQNKGKKNMMPKVVIIAIALFVLLVVGVLLVYFLLFSGKSQLDKCLEIDTENAKDACLQDLAENTWDAKICSMLEFSKAQGCYFQVAKVSGNDSICLKIEENDQRHYCIASATNDIKKCDMISDIFMREGCQRYAGIPSQKPKSDGNFGSGESGCEIIQDSRKRQACWYDTAIETKDISLCEKIAAGPTKESCYSVIGMRLQDETICAKITDLSRRDGCYTNISITSKNPQLCNKVGSDTWRAQFCLYPLALLLKDRKICEMIPELEKLNYREACFRKMSELMQDATLCDKLEDQKDIDICKLEAGMKNNDTNTCLSITNTTRKDQCLRNVGSNLKDLSICNMIGNNLDRLTCSLRATPTDYNLCSQYENIDGKNSCYSRIAIDTNNSNLCQYIESSRLPPKDYCYEAIAKTTGDVNLCEKIEDSNRKISCRGSIKENSVSCAFVNDQRKKDSCYQSMGIDNGKPEYCEKIVDV